MFRRPLLVLTLAAVAIAVEPITVTVPGAGGEKAEDKSGLTLQQKASYVMGQQIVMAIKRFDLDDAMVQQAMADAKANKPALVPEGDAQQVMGAWQQEMQARQAKVGDARKDTNKVWLATNAKKDGVKATASGLQYKVLAAGKGKQPKSEDQVSVNYKGTLTDGTEFDASAKHGGPATFGVGQVIKGWTEALQLMKEGDKWELYIPSELAYGDQAPPNIGPNQILVFEVELLKVLDSKPATP